MINETLKRLQPEDGEEMEPGVTDAEEEDEAGDAVAETTASVPAVTGLTAAGTTVA